jgi:flagellar biosynthesis activator protein FlaF
LDYRQSGIGSAVGLRNLNKRAVQTLKNKTEAFGVRDMHYASKAYAKVAKETAPPRELEASLLLKATAKLQAVYDSWRDSPAGLHDALMYNRRLWMVFIDAVQHEGNKLPITVRDNLTKLGAFVLGETFALMTDPKPDHLKSIIKINRGIAAGLRAKN